MSETPEFSRRIPLDRIGPRPAVHTIEATPAECKALAARFGILSVDGLSAEVTLQGGASGRVVDLAARVRARVTQACVVTLEPVRAEVVETFAVVYATVGDGLDAVEVDPDPDDPAVEPLPSGAIDIGESVAQQVSLALDPYPRSPAARIEPSWSGEGESRPAGPFSALESLKGARRPKRS